MTTHSLSDRLELLLISVALEQTDYADLAQDLANDACARCGTGSDEARIAHREVIDQDLCDTCDLQVLGICAWCNEVRLRENLEEVEHEDYCNDCLPSRAASSAHHLRRSA